MTTGHRLFWKESLLEGIAISLEVPRRAGARNKYNILELNRIVRI